MRLVLIGLATRVREYPCGRLAQMVERSLSMREARGSIPRLSKFLFFLSSHPVLVFGLVSPSCFFFVGVPGCLAQAKKYNITCVFMHVCLYIYIYIYIYIYTHTHRNTRAYKFTCKVYFVRYPQQPGHLSNKMARGKKQCHDLLRSSVLHLAGERYSPYVGLEPTTTRLRVARSTN